MGQPDPDQVDLGALYASARQRIAALLADADDEAAVLPVPATPEWTVHDVVAHLRGIVADAISGNTDGVATDPWTAAQVERSRDVPLVTLLADWHAEAPLIEAFLSSPDGVNAARAVIDVHTHEADLRGALGLAPALPDDYGRWMAAQMSSNVIEACAAAGLPSLRVRTDEGDEIGPADAAVTLRLGRHELHRAVLGRRATEQVAAYDWGGADPQPYVEHLAVFGPRSTALVD